MTGGRALRTLRGTLDEVIAAGEQAGDAYLRVVLAEPGRAGLGDLVRDKLPNALEVQLDEAHRPQPGAARRPAGAGPAGRRSSCSATTSPSRTSTTRGSPGMFADCSTRSPGRPDAAAAAAARRVRQLPPARRASTSPTSSSSRSSGPTGSGKSTLIDGLCFALYGTVPRWGKENAIAEALAPAANACRVGLVFELAGQPYAAVRVAQPGRQGRVHTKEARLELLDPAIRPARPSPTCSGASSTAGRGPRRGQGPGRRAARAQLRALHPVGAAAAGPVLQVPAGQAARTAEAAGRAAGVRRLRADRPARPRAGQDRRRADQPRPREAAAS